LIVIVDYGVGNVRSLANMLKKLGTSATITNDVATIEKATKLILPGVGAFDTAMEDLTRKGIKEVLQKKALKEKIPILGICLGMQLLTNGSEEGKEKGFGWIPGYTYKFPKDTSIKVPHMGWNNISILQENELVKDLAGDSRFYFVHSYYVKAEQPQHTLLQATHGICFDAAIQKENIYGVQFHPERSHKYGMKILSNFIQL
jgi:glutamine amidotransferase